MCVRVCVRVRVRVRVCVCVCVERERQRVCPQLRQEIGLRFSIKYLL